MRIRSNVVRALITAKADLNQGDDDGQTPLSRAAIEGHTGIFRLLLKAGAVEPPAPGGGGPWEEKGVMRSGAMRAGP